MIAHATGRFKECRKLQQEGTRGLGAGSGENHDRGPLVRGNRERRNGFRQGSRGARDGEINQVTARGWIASGSGGPACDHMVQ
jgi:hypothetical protein